MSILTQPSFLQRSVSSHLRSASPAWASHRRPFLPRFATTYIVSVLYLGHRSHPLLRTPKDQQGPRGEIPSADSVDRRTSVAHRPYRRVGGSRAIPDC